MWSCHQCGKPVFFAERKQSLGYDWHPECLRCEECGKRLNPGQHAEHKGVPYCNVPCYSILFGPTLFGHGSQVGAHTSFGKAEKKIGAVIDRERLEAKLRLYNQYYEGKSLQLACKERNGKLLFEGVLHIFWRVQNVIRLQEDDDSICGDRKRFSVQGPLIRKEEESNLVTSDEGDLHKSGEKSALERNALRQTMPNSVARRVVLPKIELNNGTPPKDQERNTNDDSSEITTHTTDINDDDGNDVVVLRPHNIQRLSVDLSRVRIRKFASSRSKTKLKRRCSINGHFYNRETSAFTPTHGSASNVWASSFENSVEVISLLLDKFRVENSPEEFALYVVRDTGETRRLKDDECPLLVRVMLGPHEDVAKIFVMDKRQTNEISNQVAQYLNLQEPELLAILRKFQEEEEREVKRIRQKFSEMRRFIRNLLQKHVPSQAS